MKKIRFGTAFVVVVALSAIWLLAGTGASGAIGESRVGHIPRVPRDARAVGSVSPSRTLGVDVILHPDSLGALSSYAEAVSTPGSSDFRHFLTASQFAARFGAPGTAVHTVATALRGEGLHVDGEASDGLMLRVSGTASSFERAWHTSLENYRLPGGDTGFVDDAAPELPSPVASRVSEIVGLDSLSSPQPQALRASGPGALTTGGHAAERARLTTHQSGPQPTGSCASAISTATTTQNPIAWSYPELAEAYGYDNVYGTGDLGQRETVALIEFATYSSSDISTFEDCFSQPPDPTIAISAVDGGPGAGGTAGPGVDVGGEEEVELDIETIVGLAPDASIDVYEGPAAGSDAAILDTYTAAIDNPSVNVISTSWGNCEAAADSSLTSAEATLFQQAAIEGKTVAAASGDDGSEDCYGVLRGSAGTALAVDDPGSQPYVTAVGGTDLSALGPPSSETVWNGSDSDGLSGGAGGGGVSSRWQMPSYQADSPPPLNVVNTNSACSSGSGDCREVPDVSANAGALVAVYCTEAGRDGCDTDGWTGFAGTSVAAPTWAALFALADASAACGGNRLGFANPALYSVASGTGYGSAFTDITSGNNDLLDVHNGTYAAGPGYDMASGLGTPIAGSGTGTDDGLVAQLCSTSRPSSFPTQISATATTTKPATTSTPTSSPTTAAVSKLSPDAGPRAGGIKVTIVGSGFKDVSAVHFGTKKAKSFNVYSTTKLIAVAPTGTSGVYVTVTTTQGTSSHAAVAKFVYLPSPAVTHINPMAGRRAGGIRVTIVGSGFKDVSAVHFGTKKAKSFKVYSTTKLIAVSPKATSKVPVTVTSPGGTSRARSTVEFRFG